MRIITGTRGSGKTVTLVSEANILHAYGNKCLFVVLQKNFEDILRNAGLNKDIKIITLAEYNKDKAIYTDFYIFLDEVEFLLHQLFPCKYLAASLDKERMIEVNWRKK